MKKQGLRFAAVLTALVMLCGACTVAVPASAATINSVTIADGVILNYITTTNGQATITGITSTVSNVHLVIPSTIKGYKVSCISASAFYNKDYLTTVYIPDTITAIDASAFIYCSNLKSVIMENGNDGRGIGLGSGIFAHCTSLTDITLSNRVHYFPNTIFQDCEKLKTLTMHGNITSSKDNTFTGCDALTMLNFERGVTRIKNVFGQLSNLTRVIIVNSNATIDDNAFSHGSNGPVICGYKGSTAEQFAKKHGNPFFELSTNPKDRWHQVLADANKDGSIDIRDVTCLQRYLARK